MNKKGGQMNKKRLKLIMNLHGDTCATLAEYLGITRATLSLKLNNKSDFKATEINKIIDKYGLPIKLAQEIFF